MQIKNIIFDFDGTCTQIPIVYGSYLSRYLEELNKRVYPQNPVTLDEWRLAQEKITENSPKAAWTISVTPSSPAAPDPYILAFESSKVISRNRNNGIAGDPPPEIHKEASDANQAPWRIETREVFETLLAKDINLYFISNSSSLRITQRLTDLLSVSVLPVGIKVQSDANKFRICELAWDAKDKNHLIKDLQLKFEELSVAYTNIPEINRPVYLRRGSYFEAMCRVLNNDLTVLDKTVFCGDIWEMDLAMPSALGAKIHLIERAAPFNTYNYELNAVTNANGKISSDLRGLLSWL